MLGQLTRFCAFTQENGLYFNQQIAIAAIQATALPGRMELIANQPTTYIDGAHNISAIEVLLKALKATFADKKIIMYFSSLDRKEITGSLEYIQAIQTLNYISPHLMMKKREKRTII